MPILPRNIKKTKPFTGFNQDNYKLYTSMQWRKTSHAYRAQHPICELCEKEGRITAAVMVDHIIPIRDGGKVWDFSNLQALCKRCNAQKTTKQGHK